MKRLLLGGCLALALVATMAQLNLVNVSTGVVGILPAANGGTGNAGTGISIPNGSAPELNVLRWTGNVAELCSATNGGTVRNCRILAGTNGAVIIQNGGSDSWSFDGSKNLVNLSTGVLSTGAAPATPLANSLFVKPTTFGALGTPTAGTVVYCSDCTVTTAATCPGTAASCVCAGSGNGALAIRINTTWACTAWQ